MKPDGIGFEIAAKVRHVIAVHVVVEARLRVLKLAGKPDVLSDGSDRNARCAVGLVGRAPYDIRAAVRHHERRAALVGVDEIELAGARHEKPHRNVVVVDVVRDCGAAVVLLYQVAGEVIGVEGGIAAGVLLAGSAARSHRRPWR